MAVEVGRSFDELTKKVEQFNSKLKLTEPELRALNRALALNPQNVELTNQKFGVFAEQLKLNRDKAQALQGQMGSLQQEIKDNGDSTGELTKQHAKLAEQLKFTSIEVSKLEGAIDAKNKATAAFPAQQAEKAQRDLQRQLRDTQRQMLNTQMAMRNISSTLTGLGLESDEAGQRIQRGMQTAVSGIQSVIALQGVFKQAMATKEMSMAKLSAGAMGAFAAFSAMSGIINILPGPLQKTASILATLTGGLTAAAIAGLALKGTLSFGKAVPIILTAVGLGAAGLRGIINSDNGTSVPSISVPDLPPLPGSPSNNTNNNGGSNNTPVQISYEAIRNSIVQAGLDLERLGVLGKDSVIQIDGREIARVVAKQVNKVGGVQVSTVTGRGGIVI